MAPDSTATNGILPISVAAIQKSDNNGNHNRNPGRRAPTARLKVVIRRLPPGLTLNEYETAVGDEWKSGKGKVDWIEFRAGKISKDMAKPSRPTRVYLHLTDQKHLATLSDKVKQCVFTDAKNTSKDAALIGPPVLEFAPYPRVPGGRRRNDARQGTIDQDPDFQLFLESLTNPITKPTADSEPAEVKEKITTTPLIEAIREKKAAKEKPNVKGSANKTGKTREETKDIKEAEIATASPEKSRKSGRVDKSKATQETPKTPQRDQNASKQVTTTGSASGTPGSANQAPQPTLRSNDRRRERPQMSVAAKIQRDLGLGQPQRRDAAVNAASPATGKPGDTTSALGTASPAPSSAASSPHRSRAGRSRQSSRAPLPLDKANLSGSTDATKSGTSTSQPTILAKSGPTSNNITKAPAVSQPPIAPTAPAASVKPSTAPAESSTAPTAPQTGGRHAFLKHANPSQGVTEPLILEAFKVFGGIDRVEIDKRKGFAYVDFADAEGLRKAITASPIKVAQGAVQVLEKKDRRPGPPLGMGPIMGAPAGMNGGAARGGTGHRGRGGRIASVRGGPAAGSRVEITSSVVATGPTAAATVSPSTMPASADGAGG